MIPPSLVFLPIRGTKEAMGAITAFIKDEEATDLRFGRDASKPVRSIVLPMGDDGAEEPDVSVSASINSPNEGITLSFALRLRNRNNGMNQTQTAKNAATSIKLGGSFTVLWEYRYRAARARLAS